MTLCKSFNFFLAGAALLSASMATPVLGQPAEPVLSLARQEKPAEPPPSAQQGSAMPFGPGSTGQRPRVEELTRAVLGCTDCTAVH